MLNDRIRDMSVDLLAWENFSRNGHIGMYLFYKALSEKEEQNGSENSQGHGDNHQMQ